MKILLAVDGFMEAYEAGQLLAHLSKPHDVLLLHVLDMPTTDYPLMTPKASGELYQSILLSMREEGERTLTHAATFLPPHIGSVEKRVVTGSPTDIIISIARQEDMDILLMGARGVGAMSELLLGSVSHRVLSHAPCPVLILKNPVRAINRILVPLKGPDDATAAVKFLSTNPFKGIVDVTIFTAVNFAGPPCPADSSVREAIRAAFSAVEHEVKNYRAKRASKEIRVPPISQQGVICKLFPQERFGCILQKGGGEIYFHEQALYNLTFEELENGMEVAFNVEEGLKGTHATSVNRISVLS